MTLHDARALTVSVEYDDLLRTTLPAMCRHFAEVLVVTSPSDVRTQVLAESHGARVLVTDAFYRQEARFNKGLAVEEGFDALGRTGWICVIDADILLPERIGELDAQPGRLYQPHRRILENVRARIGPWERYRRHREVEFAGYFQLFHADDPVLTERPWYGTTWTHAGGGDSEFATRWSPADSIRFDWDVLHLGPIDTNWFGRVSARADGRPGVSPNGRLSQMRSLFHLRRKHGCEREHVGTTPTAMLAEAMARLGCDPDDPRIAARIKKCRACQNFFGNWCWTTHGAGSSTDRFVRRILSRDCQTFTD
ncbi:MAG: glycosyltransferase family A protein [Planctomycetota bacterium]